MVDVPTRTLQDYFDSLPNGGVSGVVSKDLTIRNDLVTGDQAVPAGGLLGQVLSKTSNDDFDMAWVAAGAGDMQKSVYDPQEIEADAFARANHTGTQSYTTITGLGTASVANTGDFATAAQGAMAASAVQPTTAQTLTNKRITPRAFTVASTATLTPDSDAYDIVSVTAQAAALSIAAPSGTPTDGQQLIVRFRDNGTARAVSWNAAYSSFSSDLPPMTSLNYTMTYVFLWNTATSKWDLISGNPIPGKFG